MGPRCWPSGSSAGRDQADSLAEQNRELYTNQLSVARQLQQSLLPQRMPEIDGLEVSARYVPGVAGLDIGGDWYDVIDIDHERAIIVVGDVSGRGVEAGTLMASLRYAIRAFASRGDDPAAILAGLTRLLDLEQDGHFATVLCATVRHHRMDDHDRQRRPSEPLPDRRNRRHGSSPPKSVHRSG